jgi:AcrR family transcriptional regulator
MAALVNRERRAKAQEIRRKRRSAILAAAAELFEKQSYESVNLDAIGRRVGVAKGIASLHFATKEELFLEVMKSQLDSWFDAVERKLQQADEPLERELLVELLTAELAGRPAMTRLLCVLRNVMEQNVEILPAQNFLSSLRDRTLSLARTIEQQCASFQPGEGDAFMRRLGAVVAGLRQPAALSGVFQALVEDDDMASLRAITNEELRILIEMIMPK